MNKISIVAIKEESNKFKDFIDTYDKVAPLNRASSVEIYNALLTQAELKWARNYIEEILHIIDVIEKNEQHDVESIIKEKFLAFFKEQATYAAYNDLSLTASPNSAIHRFAATILKLIGYESPINWIQKLMDVDHLLIFKKIDGEIKPYYIRSALLAVNNLLIKDDFASQSLSGSIKLDSIERHFLFPLESLKYTQEGNDFHKVTDASVLAQRIYYLKKEFPQMYQRMSAHSSELRSLIRSVDNYNNTPVSLKERLRILKNACAKGSKCTSGKGLPSEEALVEVAEFVAFYTNHLEPKTPKYSFLLNLILHFNKLNGCMAKKVNSRIEEAVIIIEGLLSEWEKELKESFISSAEEIKLAQAALENFLNQPIPYGYEHFGRLPIEELHCVLPTVINDFSSKQKIDFEQSYGLFFKALDLGHYENMIPLILDSLHQNIGQNLGDFLLYLSPDQQCSFLYHIKENKQPIIEWAKHSYDLSRILSALELAPDARFNFFKCYFGREWITKYEHDIMDLKSLMEDLKLTPEAQFNFFEDYVGKEWLIKNIKRTDDLHWLIKDLTAEARFNFFKRYLDREWIVKHIIGAYELTRFMENLQLAPEARFNFFERYLGKEWIAKHIIGAHKLIQLMKDLQLAPEARFNFFERYFGKDWIAKNIRETKELNLLMKHLELAPEEQINFLKNDINKQSMNESKKITFSHIFSFICSKKKKKSNKEKDSMPISENKFCGS